jgi:hypothetical protein
MKKGVESGVGSVVGSADPELEPDPNPLVRGTDPGIRIRTKMARIPNTDQNYEHRSTSER